MVRVTANRAAAQAICDSSVALFGQSLGTAACVKSQMLYRLS